MKIDAGLANKHDIAKTEDLLLNQFGTIGTRS
jgi:hypothetical protein